MGNKSCRGQQELLCLKAVKKYVPVWHPVRLYVDSAIPNGKPNEFPDFIFDGGFIEHFQVTSAKETKKGDRHRISESIFEKESQNEFEKKKQEFLFSKPIPGTLSSQRLEMDSPEYGYDYFVESFKRNFEHHIGSLDKYDGDKSVGVFMLEHTGARITVLRNGSPAKLYKIEYDIDLLSYLYGFRDKLKYLICFWGDTVGDSNGGMSCEIIEISKIPEILKNAPQDVSFGVGRVMNLKINLFLDL